MSEWSEVDEFLDRPDVENTVWFIGGYDCSENEITDIVDEAMRQLQHHEVGVITGGTEGGLPEIAATKANQYDIPTMGVVPERGEKYLLEDVNDHTVTVEPTYGESSWGDESEIGAKVVDGLMLFGGSEGTMAEYSLCQKNDPAYAVAVANTGGLADDLQEMGIYSNSEYTPSEEIQTGGKAAEFILENLGVNEEYDTEATTSQV